MFPTIVPTYAAVLAFGYFALSLRVIRARRNARVGIGTGGNHLLERTIRVHANFAEYVPLALLLLAFLEMQSNPHWLVHFLCLGLVAGRAVHAVGVSQTPENLRLRVAGMTATFTVLIVAAALLLVHAFLMASA